jgi:signal transduction histidine kinase
MPTPDKDAAERPGMNAKTGASYVEGLLTIESLQRAIFNSANFWSMATDANGVIRIFNVGAERMLGYTAAEVINKITPADISDPQEVMVRAQALSVGLSTPIAPGFQALVFKASRGVEDSYELTYLRKDGSRFPAVVSVTALRDAQDVIIGYLLMGTDNTARKDAEEALESTRNDQMRLKDDVLLNVSQELRSPLTAIKQFTSILLGGMAGELNQEQREYQQIVVKNILQLQAMIDDLLDVTRLETGQVTVALEGVSILDAITDTFNTLQISANAKGISLTCHVPADLPSAHADQIRVRQILAILVDNAIKFSPRGGGAVIRARLVPHDPRFLLLEVADAGCGISPDRTERIFERAYQDPTPVWSSRKGLGMGLYICKQLVMRQGGEIWVNQQAQKGSTFSLTNLMAPARRAGVSANSTVVAPS